MHVAIILAKGGSIGLPDKNILMFRDKPLISHTIDDLRKSACFDEIYVSTNCDKVAKISEADGVDIIWRSDEYARNDRYVDAVNHAVDSLHTVPETITIPQVVQPLRQPELFQQMLSLHYPDVDSVVTVCKLESSIDWIYAIDKSTGFINQINDIRYGDDTARQDNYYIIDNAVVSFTYASWKRSNSITPWPYLGRHIVPVEQKHINRNFTLDIHTPDDAEWLEFISTFPNWKENRI
ncbi:cytidylyltransferase domain-containing protein [Chloroflexota bacterium]